MGYVYVKIFLGHLCTKVRPYIIVCNYRVEITAIHHHLVETMWYIVS